MTKKFISSFTLIIALLFVVSTLTVMAQTQISSTPYNRKAWLSGDNKYVEYDFGSWLPNDDAWLKAEVYGGTNRSVYVFATAGNTTAFDSGEIIAIVEMSGIDYFDAYSYAKASNHNGYFLLSVTE